MIRIGFILLLALLAGGCENRHFGVSQAKWQQLDDAQRAKVIEDYSRWEEAWLERVSAERDRDPNELTDPSGRVMSEEAQRVEKIYRGEEEGLPGQLIRVTISKGTLNIDGQPRPYQEVRELLAEGESRLVVVLEADSRPRTTRLLITYRQGTLYLDDDQSLGTIGYPYRPDWEPERLYDSVYTNGPATLRDALLKVEAIEVTPSRWPEQPRERS